MHASGSPAARFGLGTSLVDVKMVAPAAKNLKARPAATARQASPVISAASKAHVTKRFGQKKMGHRGDAGTMAGAKMRAATRLDAIARAATMQPQHVVVNLHEYRYYSTPPPVF